MATLQKWCAPEYTTRSPVPRRSCSSPVRCPTRPTAVGSLSHPDYLIEVEAIAVL
jgi:hypothetical protein